MKSFFEKKRESEKIDRESETKSEAEIQRERNGKRKRCLEREK